MSDDNDDEIVKRGSEVAKKHHKLMERLATSPQDDGGREWTAVEIFQCVNTGDDRGLPDTFISAEAFEKMKLQLAQAIDRAAIAERGRDDALAKIRYIEFANKYMSRNDHAEFGKLLTERNDLRQILLVVDHYLSVETWAYGEYERIRELVREAVKPHKT